MTMGWSTTIPFPTSSSSTRTAAPTTGLCRRPRCTGSPTARWERSARNTGPCGEPASCSRLRGPARRVVLRAPMAGRRLVRPHRPLPRRQIRPPIHCDPAPPHGGRATRTPAAHRSPQRLLVTLRPGASQGLPLLRLGQDPPSGRNAWPRLPPAAPLVRPPLLRHPRVQREGGGRAARPQRGRQIVQTYGHGLQGALQRLHRGTERPAEIRSGQTLRAREGAAW
jgi:hypothetical protein